MPQGGHPTPSFNHLVSAGKQCWWDFEAKHPGSLGIDDEFELRRLKNGFFPRSGTLEDTPAVNAGLTPSISNVSPVTYQTTGFCKVTGGI
jgi:hypothetical protein